MIYTVNVILTNVYLNSKQQFKEVDLVTDFFQIERVLEELIIIANSCSIIIHTYPSKIRFVFTFPKAMHTTDLYMATYVKRALF